MNDIEELKFRQEGNYNTIRQQQYFSFHRLERLIVVLLVNYIYVYTNFCAM